MMISGREIEALVEDILIKAKKEIIDGSLIEHPLFSEAINWGDLHCVEVERVQSLLDENQEFYRIWIEEAAPYCEALKKYIIENLPDLGIEIQIMTEW